MQNNTTPKPTAKKLKIKMKMTQLTKLQPQAKDIEEAVLGAALLVRDAVDTITATLHEDSFYVPANRTIFNAIKTLAAVSQPVDILTVQEQLRKTGDLDKVGGSFYVTTLTNSVVSDSHLQAHCRILTQKYIQREIIRMSGELMAESYAEACDPLELLDRTGEMLSGIIDKMQFGDMAPMSTVLVDTIKQIEEWRNMDMKAMNGVPITGIPSGFRQLDLLTRGWQNGDFIIIAARPSVGKTAFVLNLLRKSSEWLLHHGGGCIAMFSLEMKASRLMLRLLSAASKTDLYRLQTGRMDEADMKTLYQNGIQSLSRLGVFFDDNAGLTIQKLRSKLRKLKAKNGLKMAMIDYLQLMTPDDKKNSNREQEISRISRELKNLAQELNIPIIALSQLSREIEKRGNGIPVLSDLRESGSLEQDADFVGFLYGHTEAEIMQDNSLKSKRYFKIAKQREGSLDTVEFDFKGEYQLFEDMDGLVPVQF